MERSLKHMPILSKKYFHASSPSVFVPYIIGIQSDKYDFLFITHHLSFESLHDLLLQS